MPLPDNQLQTAEIMVLGTLSAAGSGVSKAYSIFHYRRLAFVNPLSKANLSAAFQTNVLVPLLAATNSRYSPNNITIRMLDDPLDYPTSFTAAGAGAIGTDSAPSNDAVYINLQSGLRGRSFMGSKHFAGVSESDTTGDVLTGAGLTRWQAVRDACKLQFNDASPNSWKPCIYSRKLSLPNQLPRAGIITSDVTNALLDLNVGTMRRRRTATVR